jgi:molecular chaperone DnaK
MRLGIDFGTTRTVVAVADRGNYPVVSFKTEMDDLQQWYPVLAAVRGREWVFAMQAQQHQYETDWAILRSFKRLLGGLAPESPIRLGGQEISALELMARYLAQLYHDLQERSNLEIGPREQPEVLISVPANANSNQRFLTLEGFRRAGFRVLGMVNEPSAAGIEYAQLYSPKTAAGGTKKYLVVYDLGGGTFDVSVIGMRERRHEVLTDEGIAMLGGDDFDELLLDLALRTAGIAPDLSESARSLLLEECRSRKESLHPNTRKVIIDLSRAIEGAGEIVVTTEEFYKSCMPLIEQTIGALEAAVHRAFEGSGIDWPDVDAIYVVGGASDLPVVLRILRERFGRRVRRSTYPYASTAIGLAIAADAACGYALQERFTRYFGVWREAEEGRKISFDPIFVKDALLPGASEEPLSCTRTYHPAHNLGHFRYLECSQLTPDGQPAGDITPWNEILFALDPVLIAERRLDHVAVLRQEGMEDQIIEERYSCDSNGVIAVTIANKTSGYERTYGLRGPSLANRESRKSLSRKK